MATPDPSPYWSGAPKHWVHVPAQRCCPPAPDRLDAGNPGADVGGGSRGEWTVAAIALAVAVAAFVLIGTCCGVPEADSPHPEGRNDTSVR